MKIIYIAGPLTSGWDGKDRSHIERNVQAAEKYQVALANVGIGTFCPHVHTSFHHEKGSTAPESYYYELDMEILKRSADGLLAMPGWEKSMGARAEVEWATQKGIPVFYSNSHAEIDEILEWSKNDI